MKRARSLSAGANRRALLLALLGLTLAPAARAAAPAGARSRPPVGMRGAARPLVDGPAAARFAVIIAGEEDCAPALRALLGEQLEDLATAIDWSCQPSVIGANVPFDPAHPGPVDAHIWIDLSPREEARLTLRDDREDRFFVRRLLLARGLDELGREKIAGVVRSATIAVLTGARASLTRAEARATVARWPVLVPPGVVPARPAPMPRQAPLVLSGQPTELAPERPPLSVELGPAFSVQSLAKEIPLAGEIALSAELLGRRLSLWSEPGYRLPAQYDGQRLGVRLTALSLRAGFAVWTSPERPFRLGVGAGAVAKRIWFSPSGDATVDVGPPGSFDLLAGRILLALRYRASRRIVLGLDLHCDIATADVHFDYRNENGTTQRTFTEWPVQPGLGVVASWLWDSGLADTVGYPTKM